MMKKIFSLLAAGFLALGLMGCSGLHDSQDLPYDGNAFISGGFNGDAFEPMTREDDGSYTYTYTYNGEDGWGGLSGESHFTILSEADWDAEFRWQSNADDPSVLEPWEFDNHIILKELNAGSTYKIVATLTTQGGTIKAESADAPVFPTPFYLHGFFISGSMNEWKMDGTTVLAPNELDKQTGVVTYIYDFTASETTHEFGIANNGWSTKYTGATFALGETEEYVKTTKGENSNNKITGLTNSGSYRLYVQTTPDETVSFMVEEIASYTLKFEVTNLEEGNVAWINGSFWGSWDLGWPITSWNAPTKEGYDAAVADSAGVAAFDSKWNVTGAGKIGDTLSWEFKALAAESESAWNDEENLILNPRSNMSFELELKKSGTYKVSINAQTEKVEYKLEE